MKYVMSPACHSWWMRLCVPPRRIQQRIVARVYAKRETSTAWSDGSIKILANTYRGFNNYGLFSDYVNIISQKKQVAYICRHSLTFYTGSVVCNTGLLQAFGNVTDGWITYALWFVCLLGGCVSNSSQSRLYRRFWRNLSVIIVYTINHKFWYEIITASILTRRT